MAVLSDQNRSGVWAAYMEDTSRDRGPLPLTKADLRAAVDAIDAWVDTNASAFNSAIPQPARGALTSKQKAGLLLYVVKRRYEVS